MSANRTIHQLLGYDKPSIKNKPEHVRDIVWGISELYENLCKEQDTILRGTVVAINAVHGEHNMRLHACMTRLGAYMAENATEEEFAWWETQYGEEG